MLLQLNYALEVGLHLRVWSCLQAGQLYGVKFWKIRNALYGGFKSGKA